ncbi:MAG: NAD-dependent epimerase/dehydratase family protein [Gammaproteobacteria bacterium]|jgi:nucleoside-diphosphate-sugar epimerase|nr:hypothetical protein [Gammaproteobacteria bacterium]MDP6095846.1 NAD-dependent epimerase/dehydratase family protein [Gammaproteobacteria bacterium]|tara:strand:+ start:2863 stop:3828 length:966 start_codon:yes stop_codon:yes gene_type:complete
MNSSDESQAGNSVLVTGANGFIGSCLCARLLQQGCRLTALLHSPSEALSATLDRAIVADVCDAGSLGLAFDSIDTVFHLAGVAHVNTNKTRLLRQVNVVGTSNVLQAAVAANVRRLVFLSSSLVHACETGKGDITVYGQSKLEAEQLLMAAHANQQIEVVILRPVNAYGTAMKGNIRRMISLIANKRLPPLPRLENELSLVGVEDLVSALMLAANSMAASGKTYYVTDGESYRINDIEQAIYKALGRNRPGWYSPRVVLYAASALAGRVGKIIGTGINTRTYYNLVNSNCFSNQQIQDELGFSPTSNLYAELPAIVKRIAE